MKLKLSWISAAFVFTRRSIRSLGYLQLEIHIFRFWHSRHRRSRLPNLYPLVLRITFEHDIRVASWLKKSSFGHVVSFLVSPSRVFGFDSHICDKKDNQDNLLKHLGQSKATWNTKIE